MATPLTIRFLEEMELDDVSIRAVRGLIGLYFIYLVDVQIPYPTCPSRLIYIGMSESRRNSISNRLRDHKSGQSDNPGLTNYITRKHAKFSYHASDYLRILGTSNPAELEATFMQDFLNHHGSNPICNNQAGGEIGIGQVLPNLVIDWKFYA